MKRIIIFLIMTNITTSVLLGDLPFCTPNIHALGIPLGPYKTECCRCKVENDTLTCEFCKKNSPGSTKKLNPTLSNISANGGKQVIVSDNGDLQFAPFGYVGPTNSAAGNAQRKKRNLK